MPVYSATNLDQANASGAIAYATWLLDRYPRAYARGELNDALLDAPVGLATQILDEAQRRVRAGERLEATDPDKLLSNRSIPVNELLPSGCAYRYRIVLEWTDPIGGGAKSFDASVCEDRALTFNEAKELALQMAIDSVDDYGPAIGSITQVSEADIAYHALSVERVG